MDQEVGFFGVGCVEGKGAQGPTEACEGKIPQIGFGAACEADGVGGCGGGQKAWEALFTDVVSAPHQGDHAAFLGLLLEAALDDLEAKGFAQRVDPTIDMVEALAKRKRHIGSDHIERTVGMVAGMAERRFDLVEKGA